MKDKVRKIFIEEDPMGLYDKRFNNIDEYDFEITKILNNWKENFSEDELEKLLWETFVEAFGEKIIGSREKYKTLSHKLFSVLRAK